MFTQFGDKTRTIFLKGIENHKLHQEFEVAAGQTIKKGQPIILNANGTVQAAGATPDAHTVIGYSIHNGAAGELVTVGMKAFTIVYASNTGALDAGPVAYAGTMNSNVADGIYCNYTNTTTAGKVIGWCLDQATGANDTVRIALI